MCRNMEIPSFPALAREETRFSNYQLDVNPNPRQPNIWFKIEVNPTLNYKRKQADSQTFILKLVYYSKVKVRKV